MTRRDLLQVPAAALLARQAGAAATVRAGNSPDLVRRAEGLFRTARTDSPLFPVKPGRA